MCNAYLFNIHNELFFIEKNNFTIIIFWSNTNCQCKFHNVRTGAQHLILYPFTFYIEIIQSSVIDTVMIQPFISILIISRGQKWGSKVSLQHKFVKRFYILRYNIIIQCSSLSLLTPMVLSFIVVI